MSKYFKQMASDGRLIIISKDDKFNALLTFSICEGYLPYANKDLWEYLPHNPEGRICFVEKLISLKWSREIFRQLEKEIVNRHPQIEQAVWFRPGKINERKVVYRRRHEASL